MHKTPQRSLISIQSFSEVEKDQLKLLLNSFKCCKNSQVEEFLKNDTFANEIRGQELLFWAESIIKIAYDNVAGRVILLECEDNDKLVGFNFAILHISS